MASKNKLYGSHYIERQRSSGYKSSTYAMAEIVDNSVDADASNVKIILSEKETFVGNRSRTSLNRIFFLDNGDGMEERILNTCLTFSEGEGRNDKRIGAFGVGLPNSSISTCRRVEVFSRTKSSGWKYVFLDVDDQLERDEPQYDPAIPKEPSFEELKQIPEDIKTIVVWSNLDRFDVSKAETLISRSEKLLGRIYRYKILNGLKITFEAFRQGKADPIIPEQKVLPYDPLYVTTTENYMTDIIWEWAQKEDPRGKTPDLGHLEEFNSMYYYKRFVEGCKKDENKPLFQKLDDYWDVEYEKTLNGKKYKWKMRASFAYASIANPGVRSGGGTILGKEFGKKMSGDTHFKSANVFFIRAGREIDFGSFGLYTVTDEKNRFWTIEIHFDSDLDELMGLSNTKQSVQFKYIKRSELDNVDEVEVIPLGLQREIVWAEMSEAITRSISKMRTFLSQYAKDFKLKEQSYRNQQGEDRDPLPGVEPAVIEVIPKNDPWTEHQVEEITTFLKKRFMQVEIKLIRNQVEKYAKGYTRTIVLYAPNQTGKLFELTEIKGKLITLINTNHIYYTNVIEPLKTHPHLRIFAISIEMLIGSCALEMDRLILENDEKYKAPLENFLFQLSSRLNEFISDSGIRINPEKFEQEILEEFELM
ncbi:ATP-binding protein [Salinimicrobium oceani]|uniref:Histidine kinase-, DNA gyrase B-, and HSP90-like ATPase n=1 Tax=Salinimicrobium oceani TaxID=2722702 RepID=A0ABX1D0W8_9FLAO|nr:ATP-binding protein [Salinimicrobium oceani]NJW54162.1 hypothetical protein [Salinimicrobium oceani]